MSAIFVRVEQTLDAVGRFATKWWAWPALLVFLGFCAFVSSLLVYPGEGETLYLFGFRFGQECEFKQQFGFGCAGCGMTRSWVHAARGALWRSFQYNAAGSVLYLVLCAGGVLGLIRLVLRKPGWLKLGFTAVVVGWIGWLVLAVGIFVGRLFGVNPLP